MARALLQRLLQAGREVGYHTLRLETAVWMVEAHALYRSCGFVDIGPYAGAEFGDLPACAHLARYMEVDLSS